jgi:arabinose-5-phosphate isomerase
MSRIQDIAKQTFRVEAEAIAGLADKLTDDFDGAVRAILATRGKVIVTGMGKSGIIGRKIAATLSSTGTSSFYLHPADAYHGDLGMIEKSDIVLAISNSGQTDEILKLIPYLEANGNTVISLTGDPLSTLAKHSRYHLNVAVAEEACPLSLAPTSSTTAMLVMGDALAIALMDERGFKSEDYARLHPGGSLGRRLLTRVGDVMRRDDLPVVSPEMTLNEVIIRISDARLGVAIVMEGDAIAGLVTDGDVRRAMQKYRDRFFETPVEEIMTRSPKIVSTTDRITDAEAIMHRHKIHSLIVVDPLGKLAGIVELYDLMPPAK